MKYFSALFLLILLFVGCKTPPKNGTNSFIDSDRNEYIGDTNPYKLEDFNNDTLSFLNIFCLSNDKTMFQKYILLSDTDPVIYRTVNDSTKEIRTTTLKKGTQFEILARAWIGENDTIYLIRDDHNKCSWTGWIPSVTSMTPIVLEEDLLVLNHNSISPSDKWLAFCIESDMTINIINKDLSIHKTLLYKGYQNNSGRTDGTPGFFILGWNSSEQYLWIGINYGELVESFARIDIKNWSISEQPAPDDFNSYSYLFNAETGDLLYACEQFERTSDNDFLYKVKNYNILNGNTSVLAQSNEKKYDLFYSKDGSLSFPEVVDD